MVEDSNPEYSVVPSKWKPGFLLEKRKYATFNQMHWHNEVELAILERGGGSSIVGHERNHMKTGELAIYWGIVPHGVTKVISGAPIAYSLHIPMAWFMDWGLPARLVDRILSRSILKERLQRQPCTDLALMKHWHALLMDGDELAIEIVVHEVQARLRRVARDMHLPIPDADESHEVRDRETLLVGQMIKEIGLHHREPITIAAIAKAVGISASHAMHLFPKGCGMTIHDYIQRCRVATAQHLLLTTDTKITAVGLESGFGCAATFFTVFRKVSGQTAGQYRRSSKS